MVAMKYTAVSGDVLLWKLSIAYPLTHMHVCPLILLAEGHGSPPNPSLLIFVPFFTSKCRLFEEDVIDNSDDG
jgi:hypothetical protein